MDEIGKELKGFMEAWYAGFIRGLEALDEASRRKVLQECGKACAQSYTVQVFRQARQASPDLDSFLQNLSRSFSASKYERTGPNTLKVTYNHCYCDLVRLGLVQSPALCDCSAANLRENLQQSLGTCASVEIETSILRGGAACVLIATLGNESGVKW